jgi:hypothetical protein
MRLPSTHGPFPMSSSRSHRRWNPAIRDGGPNCRSSSEDNGLRSGRSCVKNFGGGAVLRVLPVCGAAVKELGWDVEVPSEGGWKEGEVCEEGADELWH